MTPRLQFCPFHILTKGGLGCGAGGSGAECRKEGAVSLDSLPSADGRWEGEGHPADALWGRGELWPRIPTPSLGSWKKSSLIGSFGSFLHPKHKSSAKKSGPSVLAKEGRGPPVGSGLGPCPPLTPPRGPLPAGRPAPTRVLCGPGGSPLLARRGRPCPSPPPGQHTATQTNERPGRGNAPAPKPQTPSSCPILFSRLKYKIQTIGEQRSRAALGSTRTREDYVQPLGEIVTLQSNTKKHLQKNDQTCISDKNLWRLYTFTVFALGKYGLA